MVHDLLTPFAFGAWNSCGGPGGGGGTPGGTPGGGCGPTNTLAFLLAVLLSGMACMWCGGRPPGW